MPGRRPLRQLAGHPILAAGRRPTSPSAASGPRCSSPALQTRLGPWLLACCFTILAACTVAAPKGPDANVTRPAVGKPPQPASAQAALSSEAFTPYADIGTSPSDGLALGDTYAALHTG